jgi:hypothetical protein
MPTNYNQTFSASIENAQLDFEMSTFKDICYLTIYVNGILAITSAKCTPNAFLIPPDIAKSYGNVAFECYNNEYPHPDNFNFNCKLFYVSPDEYKEAAKLTDRLNQSEYLGNYTKYFGEK